MLNEEILRLAEEIHPKMITWRRKLHQCPELGFQERQTATYIAQFIREMQLEPQEGIAETGIIARIQGGAGEGKVIALRTDIDALPITELSDVPFASRNPGMMHACGHDAHIAIVLGAMSILNRLGDRLPGEMRFIFQPAEEGPGGAEPMLSAGVLQNPRVDAILGGHVWPGLPVGQIAIQEGPVMASSNGWKLTITGRGGHAAEPHRCIDAVALGASVVVTLQQIISRTNDPQDPAVLSIGMFQAGTRNNVIAETAVLQGSLRTFNDANKERILGLIPEIARGICTPFGATVTMEYGSGYPVTANDPELTAKVTASIQNLLGEDRVITKFKPSSGAEDFSFFAKEVPGCYLFIGVSNPEVVSYPIHHNRFDIDEGALRVGAAVFAQAIVDLLLQV